MKNLIYSISVIAFMLIGCSKDSETKKDSGDQTIGLVDGSWSVSSFQYIYYNSNGSIVFQKNGETGNIYNFASGSFSSGSYSSNYVFVKLPASDKYSIVFDSAVISPIKNYEVTYSASAMTWKGESTNPENVKYTENGTVKSASKVSLFINLVKQ